MPRAYVLDRAQVVRRPLDAVFAFFSDARNLERITPAFLRFRITSADAIEMRSGALIEYRLGLHGVSFGWLTRIAVWEPPRRFVDVQVRGPYRRWEHTHSFEPIPDGTRVRDRVEYELPLGALGAIAHRVYVARALDRIFAYRSARIAEILEG
jgi:ligand-binding SRPBCC domain-containing protein